MAKNFKIKTATFEGMAASQEFNVLRTSLQIGDQFYVPNADMLLVMGTALPESTDDTGRTYPARTVGQYFPVVRMNDGNPVEVTNMYVGQLVKVDIRRAIAYPGELSSALRKGSDSFKELICDRILEATESKDIDDRVWDTDHWKRDDNNKFVSEKKTAFKFDVKHHNLSADVISKCEDMLADYYNAQYGNLVEAE